MKTRYSALVSIKKDAMKKAERVFSEKKMVYERAKKALEESFASLALIEPLSQGSMSDFLANRALLDTQRATIRHNEAWVEFATRDLAAAQEELKGAMVEYEKYNYLELQEIEKAKKAQKIKIAKELDEVALMTFKPGRMVS